MSGYHDEHNIKEAEVGQRPPPRRPDLSTFFSTLEVVDTSGTRRPQNVHALPTPVDVSAAFRTLANAFAQMQTQQGGSGSADEHTGQLLANLISRLHAEADDPPTEIEGVSDEFLASLERIPKAKLKASQSCPICANPFLDDPYPLVVRLPCHTAHLFDLECITPWLKLNPTCPLDRQTLVKQKPAHVPKQQQPQTDPDEEEYDDMYA